MNREMPGVERSQQLMEEAEQTLRAIQYGTVDAFVVEEPEGHRVYTLEGSDLPYSTLVERMQQGAAMLDARGCIVYCNLSLAKLFGMPRDTVVGRFLLDFLASEDRPVCQKLLRETQIGSSEGEMRLHLADGSLISANFSFSLISRDKSATGVLISDLTLQKQQMEFAARLQNLQDEERKRLARELHDSVGQTLAALSMNMGIVQAQSHKLDSLGARSVSDNAGLVEQVSREIRTISYLLHPPLLDLAGLASALRWYADGFSERSNIKIDMEIPSDFGRLPDELEIAIFRIVQECLTNIHRHSGSATATIRLQQEGDRLTVQVQDRGKGISLEKQHELIELGRGGVGFAGMRERLRQLGGTLGIKSDGSGTIVSATLKVA
ncbi:MAG TPA: ATP-binding protein [Candidatus Sulfotelmatobacter sp.]|jgi:PAS domain S-box-containing protein|nr:ATP-binding protein [Candidatus Sulfotelmatobacter sp.]